MAKNRVFAVIGLGTFGTKVAEVLVEKGAQVIVLDNNPETIERMKNRVTAALLIDSTDEAALTKAPLDDVDTAIVAMGDKLEASILTTALLKQRGIPYIISRAISDIHETVLRKVGANEVINLEVAEGIRVAQRLIAPEVLDSIPISQEFSLAELYTPKLFVGKPLKELKIREKFSLNIIAIKRTKVDVDTSGNPLVGEELVFPQADSVLQESDILFVVGKNKDIEELKDLE
ncbi:MAG: TrkA family potassium uptake protein [Spirochaetales bacterium]